MNIGDGQGYRIGTCRCINMGCARRVGRMARAIAKIPVPGTDTGRVHHGRVCKKNSLLVPAHIVGKCKIHRDGWKYGNILPGKIHAVIVVVGNPQGNMIHGSRAAELVRRVLEAGTIADS